MNSKDETFSKYKLYEVMMLHQRSVHIKTLISDQGGEYTSGEFKSYLAKQGTNQCLMVLQNCLNHTLSKRTCAMLFESSLPKFLWGYTYTILDVNYCI